MRDLMEISRVLMRVLKGGEVSPAELAHMSFIAESELRAALAEAYAGLLEFAHHRDLRSGLPIVRCAPSWKCVWSVSRTLATASYRDQGRAYRSIE